MLFLHPHIHLPSSRPFADQEGFAVFVYDCICQTTSPLSSEGLHQQNWPSVFLLPRHGAWNKGRRVSWASTLTPEGPPTWPPFLHPASLFIPLATRPACSPALQCLDRLLGYGRPTRKRSQVSYYYPRWTMLLPDSNVSSLFISFSIGSIFSPRLSWPLAWRPSFCPFCNCAEKIKSLDCYFLKFRDLGRRSKASCSLI